MSDDKYLTDSEYIEILNKIKDIVEEPGFIPKYHDSTAIGDKYTTSNCGFCNDSLKAVTLVTKSRKKNHRCPFDMGKETMPKGSIFINYATGCFYRCYLFQSEARIDIEKMKEMVNERIKHASAG